MFDISAIDNNNSDLFLQLRKEILNELTLNKENIHEQSLKAPMLSCKYSNYYIKLKRMLIKLENDKNKMYKDLYIYYKSPKNGFIVNTKSEVESFIFGDDKWIDIFTKCEEYKIRVEFLKESILMFKNISYIYSNFIESEKLRQGVL
jgi:hypothetical protein